MEFLSILLGQHYDCKHGFRKGSALLNHFHKLYEQRNKWWLLKSYGFFSFLGGEVGWGWGSVFFCFFWESLGTLL